MDILLIDAVPFALTAALLIPDLRRVLGQRGMTWLTAGTMAVLFVWLLTLFGRVEDGPIEKSISWVPALGLNLNFYLDGLALMFALLVTGIGVVVFFYAGYYFDDADELARFYVPFTAFAGAMLALVTIGNVLLLFIAWELTSITSFLLIGFKSAKSEDARISASRALIITGGGGLALLLGLLLLGTAAGSFEMRDILAAEGMGDHAWYTAFAMLIMIGCFAKSAQFPFHFWLPGAMTAPSPASAYLHSATMVKAGIYLLYRLYPVLGNTGLWTNGLLIIGLTTMGIGALFAIRQRDLKGLLAYSTVSKLGAIVALIGLPDGHGLKAAGVGILAHALYKATFFLLAGVVEHATGTRNLDELGGLRKRMPVAFITAALVGLSMAGFPPLLGFAAKEYLLEASLPEGAIGIVPIIVVFAASVLTVVAALLFVWDVFISRPDTEYHHYHDLPRPIFFGPGLLALLSLLTGIFIAPFVTPLMDAVTGKDTHLHILPTEINTAVILSVAVLALGPVLFAARRIWLAMPWINLPTGQQIYASLIQSVDSTGDFVLRSQNGKVRYYLVIILGVVAGLMVVGGYESFRLPEVTFSSSADILKLMLLALTIGSTLMSILFRRHLLAALSLGVSGYAVGGVFLLEPAPDVALVQFLVETLATVLIILMIARISTRQRVEAMRVLWKGHSKGGNIGIYRDIAISTVIGVSVGLFALTAVHDRANRVRELRSIEERALLAPEWYILNTYEETGVNDVVAAILADFRGTDTLLEITVFSMAALSVLTLLTIPEGTELLTGKRVTQVMRRVAIARTPDDDEDDDDEVEDETAGTGGRSAHDVQIPEHVDQYGAWGDAHEVPRMSTPLTRVVAALVFPFAILISMSHVLYGGSGPGDGFTAGVVSGLAVALWYVVFGYFEARARLRWLSPGRLISFGLLLGITNAFAGAVFGDGFLAIYFEFDGPADLHFASTMLFELSIYLVVFGGVTTIMDAIAHPEDAEKDYE